MKFNLYRKLIEKDKRWKIYLSFGVLAYFIIINQILHVRPDHIFLALFMLTFLLGKSTGKKFIADWLPFVGFWILYDMMRGVVDGWRANHINIRNVYDMEFTLFSGFFEGLIPSFWLQDFKAIYEGELWLGAIDLIAANLYGFHFAAPLLLGWILWHTHNDRKMFYRFVWTLTILNVMALITFFVFPAAPPWYIFRFGFEQPTGHIISSAGGLINVDKMIQMKFFTTLWDNFNANQFAAIPSLHAGYPIVLSLFTWIKFRKRLKWVILYPVSVWFSAVWLSHHYIIDVLITLPYVVIAYIITHKILLPKVFGPWFLNENPNTF